MKVIGKLILCFILSAIFSFTGEAKTKKAKAKAQPVKVACVGNSITYGFLVEDRENNNYPAQLGKMLGEKYQVANFGKGGTTLLKKGHKPYMAQEEFTNALNFVPDIVVIHLGVNDLDPADWPEYGDNFVSDYVALIDSFKSVNPKVRVILANLSPLLASHPRFKSGVMVWRDQVRELIPIIATATGSELIDFGETLRDRPNLLPEAIHPNAEGAGRLAKTVYGAITGDFGGLNLPEIYGDYMVLQRNKPLVINGTDDSGEKVTVTLGGNSASGVTDKHGRWTVTLPPMSAATGLTMTVTDGKKTLEFDNVAIGEVWVASGQSNMEFPLRSTSLFEQDKPLFNDSLLRFFDVKPIADIITTGWTEEQIQLTDDLKYFYPAKWHESTTENAGKFSGVAWYFGKMLRDSLNVPVGIISNSLGGSPAESWVDIETLEHNIPEILVDWYKNDYLQTWVKWRALKNIGEPAENERLEHRHPYEPSYLFSAAIRPLEAYPIAGAIWYQGESNDHNVEVHERLFPLLVDSWRANWNDPELPFIFVQLSTMNRDSWPKFRNSQRELAEAIPGVSMAVSMDWGDSLDIHPKNKRPIGERLGRQALNRVYGMKKVTPQGPTILKAEKTGANTIILTFDYAEGLTTSDGKSPRTFEVAQYEGAYQPVESVEILNDNTLKLVVPSSLNPRYVRYGWQPYTRANLVNSDGLPTSTFKIDVK
ncbi:MAG: sialate O-acetylesterase [Paramuribaculum sp.]|nr:sialate O-acetylesterase [Paramuribaculum sp.]